MTKIKGLGTQVGYFGMRWFAITLYRNETTSTLVDYTKDEIIDQCPIEKEQDMCLKQIKKCFKFNKDMDNFPDYLIELT